LFRERGYQDVRTVLASGNVVFTSDGTADALKTDVEQALRDRFGYDAWIVLVQHDDLAAIVEGFPFDSAEDRHDYVLFASYDAALDDLLVDVDVRDRVALDAALAGVAVVMGPLRGVRTCRVAERIGGYARSLSAVLEPAWDGRYAEGEQTAPVSGVPTTV
ncbi:DUF1697 domain-containing protein, partial [Bacillus sp. S34]|nr:DUF1697 domain-containing protein [Bacillus sp. S34]